VNSKPFQLIAGHVALDFANTLDNRFSPASSDELLPTYGELLRFCRESRLIGPGEEHRLARLSEGAQKAAVAAAHEFREALERIFAATARKEPIDPGDLDLLNNQIHRATNHRDVSDVRGTLRWQWDERGKDAFAPLWRIALEAGELLTSDNLRHVRECGAPTCRWLFLDSSKNQRRRWCDMKLCGNRSKARRYYEAHATRPR